MKEALCDAQWVFEAIPVKFLRSVLNEAKPCFDPAQVWVVLSKGIEQETLLFPTQIVDDVLGADVKKAIFAGPSFAQDVAKEQITAVTVAAPDCQLGKELQQLLANDYFRLGKKFALMSLLADWVDKGYPALATEERALHGPGYECGLRCSMSISQQGVLWLLGTYERCKRWCISKPV